MAAEAATFFHRTGASLDPAAVGPVGGDGLRPALFARFHDLTRLRYDYPLVLSDDPAAGRPLETLSGRVDAFLATAGDDPAGQRLHRLVLGVEREVRAALAAGDDLPFREAWEAASGRVAAAATEPAEAELERAGEEIPLDGRLVDCRAGTARAWSSTSGAWSRGDDWQNASPRSTAWPAG